jgi:quercetin dioxygenase-like cupin family protein
VTDEQGREPAMSDTATITPIENLRLSERAALFQGRDEIQASIFVIQCKRGDGPDLHLHPYSEAFVVQSGTAVFTVGEERLTVPAGNIVVVPAQTPHGFKNAADDVLRVVSVHPSPTV